MSMMVGGTSAPLEWGSTLISAFRSEWAMLTALGSFLATGGWWKHKIHTTVKYRTLMGDSSGLYRQLFHHASASECKKVVCGAKAVSVCGAFLHASSCQEIIMKDQTMCVSSA